MKPFRSIVSVLLVVAVVGAGCGRKSSVDTRSLQRSFKTAPPTVQAGVDKVVTAVKAGDYPVAMTALQKLVNQAKLTSEQQQAVHDVMTQVQEAMTTAVKKSAAESKKAVGDVKKLPGK